MPIFLENLLTIDCTIYKGDWLGHLLSVTQHIPGNSRKTASDIKAFPSNFHFPRASSPSIKLFDFRIRPNLLYEELFNSGMAVSYAFNLLVLVLLKSSRLTPTQGLPSNFPALSLQLQRSTASNRHSYFSQDLNIIIPVIRFQHPSIDTPYQPNFMSQNQQTLVRISLVPSCRFVRLLFGFHFWLTQQASLIWDL